MSTGYSRKRSRTPTRRSTRPKSFKTAVKNVIESSKETKLHRVLLSVTDTPQVGTGASAVPSKTLPFTALYPGAWMCWGHLLSNIQTAKDGKLPNTFERGGDEIHMKNIKFDLDLEASYEKGSSYRFVVWKTTRIRDYTMAGAADRNTASHVGGLNTTDDRQRRFGGPPQIQTTQVGPLLAIDNVNDGTSEPAYKGQARSGATIYGMGDKPIYSTPVEDAVRRGSIRCDTDPMKAVFDRERCTILHDEIIHMNGTNSAALVDNFNKYRCTRYVSYDKDIEFSTEFASAIGDNSITKLNILKGSLLALKNNGDYINAAIVAMPHTSLELEAANNNADNIQARQLMSQTETGKARLYATFAWKDKNIGVYGQGSGGAPPKPDPGGRPEEERVARASLAQIDALSTPARNVKIGFSGVDKDNNGWSIPPQFLLTDGVVLDVPTTQGVGIEVFPKYTDPVDGLVKDMSFNSIVWLANLVNRVDDSYKPFPTASWASSYKASTLSAMWAFHGKDPTKWKAAETKMIVMYQKTIMVAGVPQQSWVSFDMMFPTDPASGHQTLWDQLSLAKLIYNPLAHVGMSPDHFYFDMDQHGYEVFERGQHDLTDLRSDAEADMESAITIMLRAYGGFPLRRVTNPTDVDNGADPIYGEFLPDTEGIGTIGTDAGGNLAPTADQVTKLNESYPNFLYSIGYQGDYKNRMDYMVAYGNRLAAPCVWQDSAGAWWKWMGHFPFMYADAVSLDESIDARTVQHFLPTDGGPEVAQNQRRYDRALGVQEWELIDYNAPPLATNVHGEETGFYSATRHQWKERWVNGQICPGGFPVNNGNVEDGETNEFHMYDNGTDVFGRTVWGVCTPGVTSAIKQFLQARVDDGRTTHTSSRDGLLPYYSVLNMYVYASAEEKYVKPLYNMVYVPSRRPSTGYDAHPITELWRTNNQEGPEYLTIPWQDPYDDQMELTTYGVSSIKLFKVEEELIFAGILVSVAYVGSLLAPFMAGAVAVGSTAAMALAGVGAVLGIEGALHWESIWEGFVETFWTDYWAKSFYGHDDFENPVATSPCGIFSNEKMLMSKLDLELAGMGTVDYSTNSYHYTTTAMETPAAAFPSNHILHQEGPHDASMVSDLKLYDRLMSTFGPASTFTVPTVALASSTIAGWMTHHSLGDSSSGASVPQIWNDLFGLTDVWSSNRPTNLNLSVSSSAKTAALIDIIAGHYSTATYEVAVDGQSVFAVPQPAAGVSETQPPDEVQIYFDLDTAPHSYAEAKTLAETVPLIGFSGVTRLPTTTEVQSLLAKWDDSTYVSQYDSDSYWVPCLNPGVTPHEGDYVQVGNHGGGRGASHQASNPQTDPSTLVGNGWSSSGYWVALYVYVAVESYEKVVNSSTNTYTWQIRSVNASGLGTRTIAAGSGGALA